jgi:CheY-like chemotaxis protein
LRKEVRLAKLLVVDDEEAMRKLLRSILSVDGWRVLNCTFKGFGAQTATEYEGQIGLYQALEKIDNATMAKRTVYFRWS